MVDNIYDPMSEWSMFFLNNGIRVFHAYDPKIKFARIKFVMLGGTLEGDKEAPGTAHFLEHIVTPMAELVSQFGALGISKANAFTSDLSINYLYDQLIDNDKMLEVFKLHYKRLFEYADFLLRNVMNKNFL